MTSPAEDAQSPVSPPAGQWRNVPVPEPFVFGIVAGLLLQRVRPWPVPGARVVHALLGVPLVAAGFVVGARSVAAAARVHLAAPERLVTTGPFAVSRNPMYVAWAAAHLGSGVVAGTYWVLATWPVAALLIHREVRGEERALAQAFGAEYERYCASVPRYGPARAARLVLTRPTLGTYAT